jgi:hypoxanthine-guanine phosphoribosyltransferase
MKVDKKYSGQWVAIKNDKIVDSGKTLGVLTKKTDSRKDKQNLYFTLIPKGLIAG